MPKGARMRAGSAGLTQDQIRELLKGHEDTLTPLAKKEEEALKRTPCINCKAYSTQAEVNAANPFTPGHPLPNKILRCRICGVSFDPLTKLILSPPTAE